MNTPSSSHSFPDNTQSRIDAFVELLKSLERHLEAMSEDLMAGRAQAFEDQSARLGPLVAEFARAYGALPPEISSHRAILARMRVVRNTVAIQRENMARRASLVDRELQVLLPLDRGGIYGPGYGGAVGGYGRATRTATRSFTSLRA